MLADAIRREFRGRIALVSSFGAESAVLLHMVAAIDRATPVLLLDTGKLFAQTHDYRDTLVRRLGLSDVRGVQPDAELLARIDPHGALWEHDPDLCCWERKTEPLDLALAGFDAWITGRKRHQSALRRALPTREVGPDGRVKLNPLAGWDRAALDGYFARHDLPRHPLEALGYRSIGCAPCTRASRTGEDPRAGRWAGSGKTECGIHLARTERSCPT